MSVFFIALFVLIVSLLFFYFLRDKNDYVILILVIVKLFIPFYIKIFDISLGTLVYLFITILYMVKYYWYKIPLKQFSKYCLYLTFFLIILSLFSYDPIADIFQTIKDCSLIFILPIIISQEKMNFNSLVKSSYFILVLGSFVALYGIYNYFSGSNPYIEKLMLLFPDQRFFVYEEERFGFSSRVQSTIEHTITYGAFMMLLALFSLFISLRKKNNALLYLLFFLFSIAGLITASRSVLVLLIIGIFYYVFFEKTSKKIIFISVGLISLSTILTLNTNFRYYILSSVMFWDDTYMVKAGVAGSSSNLRSTQAEVVLKNVPLESSFTGLGPTYYSKRVKPEGLLGAESAVFRIFLDYGILGIIGWSVFFVKLILINFKIQAITKSRASYLLNAEILGVLAFSLATGFMGSLYFLFLIYSIQLRFVFHKNKLQLIKVF